VIVNDENNVRSFYNVCQHHAAKVVPDDPNTCQNECKKIDKFVCPYHGWRYRLDGRLEAATKLKGIQNFKASQIRLQQIALQKWGPLVFLKFFKNDASFPDMSVLEERIKPFLSGSSIEDFEKDYVFYKTVKYRVKSNWKVVLENYLDGGYHVKHLHHGLSGQLDEKSYKIESFNHYSIQSCGSAQESNIAGVDFKERIGDIGALYAYIYPNWMINVYEPMADINVVVPISVDETEIIYYYYIRKTHIQDEKFVEKALLASHQVQLEDSSICESVQHGLKSSSYINGYYAPELEHVAYHFHQMLYRDLAQEE
jgi:choline monooxygenase